MSELFIFTGVYSEIAFLSPDVCKPSNHFLPFFSFFVPPAGRQLEDVYPSEFCLSRRMGIS